MSKVPKESHATYSLQEPSEASSRDPFWEFRILLWPSKWVSLDPKFLVSFDVSSFAAGDGLLTPPGRMETSLWARASDSLGVNPQKLMITAFLTEPPVM